jgi:hypothetical protein
MPDTETETHLWDTNHPYYCEHGNYFVGRERWHEVHEEFDSWADFYGAWGNSDEDMNLVFRWDWNVPDPADYEDEDEMPTQTLNVYWVLQRKAILRSTTCIVTPDDEPAVRAWLTERAKTIRAIWAPIL